MRLPSAEEMAQYILLTGDQASVVNLIEGLVNNGKVGSQRNSEIRYHLAVSADV